MAVQQEQKRRKLCWQAIAAVLGLFVASLPALPSTANEQAAVWLSDQQSADGRIAKASDETLSQDSTFETVRALRILGQGEGAMFSAALHYLSTDATPGFPYVPHHLIALNYATEAITTLKDELLAYQNADGGFSGYAGGQSSVVDTIDALEALSEVGLNDRAVIQPAIIFLVSNQLSNGAFGHGQANDSSVYLTARAATLLQRYLLDYKLSTSLDAAIAFLWKKQQNNGWDTDWETAQALLALIPVTTDSMRYVNIVDNLRARQEANGSWGNSVYATALVLQALYLADHRAVPQDTATDSATGMLTGKIVDRESLLPIPGARVLLSGTNLEASSGSDGRFELAGIAPGTYILDYRHEAYVSAQQSVQVQAGSRLDVGQVSLSLVASTGLLQGTVSAQSSGSPVTGALIEVTGAGSKWTAVSGTDGAYYLVLPPGTFTLTVKASGYEIETATGAVEAGGILQFSPALLAAGTPHEATQTVTGRVLDGLYSSPVAGAQVTLLNSVTVTTGADGQFALTGLTTTDLTIDIQATGYAPLHMRGVVPSGGVLNLGDLSLPRITTVLTSTINGSVTDAESGTAIAGATIAIDSSSTTSDANGHFDQSGIEPLSFTVVLSAPGYFGQQYAVTLSQRGQVKLNFQLHRATFGGIDILSVTPNQAGYSAYSQVHLTATVSNSATIERRVRVGVKVMNPQGSQIEEFTAFANPAGGDVFVMPVGTSDSVTVDWYNRHYAPGAYRLWLQVYDAASSELLAERVSTVNVNETRRLDYARLAPSVSYVNQGATETIKLLLSARNRSNVPLTMDATYQWLAPDGNILRTGTNAVSMLPETMSATFTLGMFEHTFLSAGRYPFELTSFQGAEATPETGAIDVGPNIRIEPTQSIEPGTIVPQGDIRLRMKIRIEGVEAP